MLTDFQKLMVALGACLHNYNHTRLEDGSVVISVLEDNQEVDSAYEDQFGIRFSPNGDCVAVGLIRREFDYWMNLHYGTPSTWRYNTRNDHLTKAKEE